MGKKSRSGRRLSRIDPRLPELVQVRREAWRLNVLTGAIIVACLAAIRAGAFGVGLGCLLWALRCLTRARRPPGGAG